MGKALGQDTEREACQLRRGAGEFRRAADSPRDQTVRMLIFSIVWCVRSLLSYGNCMLSWHPMAMCVSDNLAVACGAARPLGMTRFRNSLMGVVGGEKTKRASRQAALAMRTKQR